MKEETNDNVFSAVESGDEQMKFDREQYISRLEQQHKQLVDRYNDIAASKQIAYMNVLVGILNLNNTAVDAKTLELCNLVLHKLIEADYGNYFKNQE